MNNDRQIEARGTLWVVLGIGLLWAGMLCADWFFRFTWYRWQVTLISRPAAVFEGPEAPMLRREVPEIVGGDLTSLLGLPGVAKRFARPRPPTTLITDEFGFRNEPPTRGKIYPVVVAGDSYMVEGASLDDLFASRLAKAVGQPVYNYAYPGRGPLFSVERLLRDERFSTHPPRVLVWGLVEREIGGDMIASMASRLAERDRAAAAHPAEVRFNGSALSSKALKTSLPSTSVIAQASKKLWNRVRYDVFGAITPEVAIATEPIDGQPMLFYTWAVNAMRWTDSERKPAMVIDSIRYLSTYCRDRGITLVVVLIPDKEQVYRERLPASLGTASGPFPDSALNGIEKGLKDGGVRVVNLLAPFRAAAQKGELLYWPDDTHWNSRGMDLAATQVGESIRDVF